MVCGRADTLGALVVGALPAARRAAIANHAASCAACLAVVDGLIHASRDRISAGAADRAVVAADVLSPGTRIGRYVIEAVAGIGGMSIVHAARDTELDRRVAIKRPRLDRRALERGAALRVDHLVHEARALERIRHPGVVTLLEAGGHGGRAFLALELVTGGSLRAWLGRPRTRDQIFDVMLDAGRGLAAAHAAGVVHGDVKPDNILVDVAGARLCDFGLAQLDPLAGDTGAGPPRVLAGTPAYMAPEQLAGAVANRRTDQWAYCATLYEALAGTRPFVAAGARARRAAIAEARLAPPVHVDLPGWLIAIVARGLCADPGERWPSLAAVVRALARGRRQYSLASGSPRRCMAHGRRAAAATGRRSSPFTSGP